MQSSFELFYKMAILVSWLALGSVAISLTHSSERSCHFACNENKLYEHVFLKIKTGIYTICTNTCFDTVRCCDHESANYTSEQDIFRESVTNGNDTDAMCRSDINQCILIGKCHVLWNGTMSIRRECEYNSTTPFIPLSRFPVTDMVTGIHYVNSACAICNSVGSYIRWSVGVDVRTCTLSDIEELHGSLNSDQDNDVYERNQCVFYPVSNDTACQICSSEYDGEVRSPSIPVISALFNFYPRTKTTSPMETKTCQEPQVNIDIHLRC